MNEKELLLQIVSDLQEFKQSQQEMRTDIRELKQSQQEMRTDIQELKQGQKSLEQGQQEMRTDIQELKQGQKSLEQGQKEIRELIVKNNVAIGEVLTQALEDFQQQPVQNKVYKLIAVEG